MIISPIRVAKSEMVLRILGLALVSYNGSNIALLFSSVSEILSQPKESVGLIRFGFGEAIFFLPLLALL